MKKNKFILLIIGLVFLSLTGCGKTNEEEKSGPQENNIKENEIPKTDALRFKDEYETLNGTTTASGQKHRTISISEENPFIYATAEEIVKKVENKETFYVYFGSNYCPWCRSVIEKALEVASRYNIDKIYYVDIWDGDHVEILRDTYKISDAGEPELVSEGGPGYQDLLKCLEDVLDDYILKDKNGKEVSVGEKRIFAPNFIYVENGVGNKIVTGESELQKGSRDELTDEILEDEEKQFIELFSK